MAVSDSRGVIVDLISTPPRCTPITRGRSMAACGQKWAAHTPPSASEYAASLAGDQYATLHPARPVCIYSLSLSVCLSVSLSKRDAIPTHVATTGTLQDVTSLSRWWCTWGRSLHAHGHPLSLCVSLHPHHCVCTCVCMCVDDMLISVRHGYCSSTCISLTACPRSHRYHGCRIWG